MNLPTEYVTRYDRTLQMLTLPCSIFLETLKRKKKNDRLSGKVVLVLQKNQDEISVSRYDLSQQKPNSVPTKSSQVNVKKPELFKHTAVIIPKTKIIPFYETPYLFRGKQEQAMPRSVVQEKAYVSTLDKFFTSQDNTKHREEWLWKAFELLNVNNHIRKDYGLGFVSQQETVRSYDDLIWRWWECWKTTLLNFDGTATELIFNKVLKGEIRSPITPPERLAGLQEIMMPENFDNPYTRRTIRIEPDGF